jgi:hypothetical protein
MTGYLPQTDPITRKRLERERKSFSVEKPTNSKPKTRNRDLYLVMGPQAIRAPALPAGSVISSSGSAWITREVPPG